MLPVNAAEFFDLPPTLARFADHFPSNIPPWEWLRRIGAALESQTPAELARQVPAGVHIDGPVYLAASVRLPAYATLIGPAWIGPNTEIRPGAFIRGNVIVGAGCVLGNACEFKNCVVMDGSEVPHFSYVGDSILGCGAHLGAGVICSNLRLDQKTITIRLADTVVDTGLRKFGAIIGERAEVGCNAVLNPGTLLGPRSLVMPTAAFSGYLPPAMIARVRTSVSLIPRRD